MCVGLCVYIYIFTCRYTDPYIGFNIAMQLCIYIYIHARSCQLDCCAYILHTYIRTYVHMCIEPYVHLHVRVAMHARIKHASMHAYTYVMK